MTHDEIQKLLDSMLIPSKGVKYVNPEDAGIKPEDINALYDIVDRCENTEGEPDYDSELKNIVEIADKYGFYEIKRNPLMDKKSKKQKLSKDGKPLYTISKAIFPFFMKQIIFYLAVNYVDWGVDKSFDSSTGKYKKNKQTQRAFIKKYNRAIELVKESEDYGVSHNYFTRMVYTPEAYVQTRRYHFPEYPYNYSGQKHGELALAIRNLVYQAGNYKAYVDLFGGSGAASVAVPKRDTSSYIYNELNPFVYNLFHVIADDELYIKFIDELDKFQKAVSLDEKYIADSKLKKSANKFYNRSGSRVEDETTLNNFDDSEIYDFLNYEFLPLVKENAPDNKTLLKVNNTNQFLKHYDEVKSFIDQTTLDKFFITHRSKKYNIPIGDLLKIYYVASRMYKYYAYFWDILNSSSKIKKNKEVEFALAKFVMLYTTTQGSEGISEVLRMPYEGGSKAKGTAAWSLVRKDFKDSIIELHNYAKRIVCVNGDCFSILNNLLYMVSINLIGNGVIVKDAESKLEKEDIIIYSDSPYTATKDYDDDNADVSEFTTDNMINLVDGLVKSDSKFIFSCRACKGKMKKSEEKKEKAANCAIYLHPISDFAYHASLGKEFYVLVEEKEDETLADRLKKRDKSLEIFITNYKISDFYGTSLDNNNHFFKVYSYWDFINIMDENLFGVEKAIEIRDSSLKQKNNKLVK